MKWPNEVIYQIFPDRFHNPHPVGEPWPVPGSFTWNGKPIRQSRRTADVTSRTHHQHTFFGGTLQGVAEKLDHLQALGVTAVYFTPVFKARSTHRYDADDYHTIDPVLGGQAGFEALSAGLRARGMKLMLDGVFNHTSYHHAWFKEHPDWYLQGPDGKPETWMGTGFLPKLNPEHPGLAEALLGVIDHWGPAVDGWRLDASHLIARSFLKQLKARVGPDRPVIGEDWDDARYDLAEGLYDGVTNFSFQRNVTAYLNGDCSPETLARRLTVVYEGYPWPGVVQSWNLLGNHDTDRFFSKIGEREAHLRLARVLQVTLPGTPLIYYGDEWGMTGFGDWAARAPMIWKPMAQQQARAAELRDLLALRRTHPVLATGRVRFLHASNQDRTLAFERYGPEGRVVVALNMGPQARTVEGLAVEPLGWAMRG